MITSKFRIDFWFGKIALMLGLLGLSGFTLYLSHRNGEFDYRHIWFWISMLTFLSLSIKAYRFFFDELKTITISEAGIFIRHLMGDTEKIYFPEIKKIDLYPVRAASRDSRSTFVSHYELVITLHDGDTLCFDGYQYKNFNALKSMIYHYLYHQQGEVIAVNP